MLYRNKYKYVLSGIDISSIYKVARPLRTKQVKDVADMMADIYKVGPLTYPEVFQCDNGSESKSVGEAWSNNMVSNDEVQAHLHGIHQGFE